MEFPLIHFNILVQCLSGYVHNLLGKTVSGVRDSSWIKGKYQVKRSIILLDIFCDTSEIVLHFRIHFITSNDRPFGCPIKYILTHNSILFMNISTIIQ